MADLISAMADSPSFRVVPPSERLTPDQILERSKLPDGTSMFAPGGSLIPAARNFATIVNSGQRVFSYRFDEAMRDSWVQARAMKRDAFILGLLEERILPTINRTHQLQVDNERDPDQKAVRDGLEKLVRAIPDFDAFKTAQMEAVWFGRAGCSWGFQRNEDLMYQWGIPKWSPVHGDSIQFTFEQVPAILMDSMTAGWYVKNGATQGPFGDIRTTDRGGMALALHRPFWRDRYSIHVHRRQMADYFEGELAGSMQGLGLRGMVYWSYVVRTDALTWMLAYMQAVGQMDLLVFNYPAGNAEAKANQEANAQKIIGKAAIACPRNPTGNWPAIEQIQMNSAGLKALHDLVADYFDRHIERLIVGQSMSSGADHGDGLGGTGRAMFAKATKDEILVYDTNRLDATLTNDLIGPLKKYNYGKAKFPVRFKSILPNLEAEGKVDNGMKLIQAGIAIKMDEMRESAGFSRPEIGDEVIGGQPSPEEIMQQMMMAQQGGQPPGGPGMPPGGPSGGPPGGMPPGPPTGPAAVFSGGQTGMAHQLPPGAPVPASRYAGTRNPAQYTDPFAAESVENGIRFATGVPVKFPMIRNTVPAPKRNKNLPDQYHEEYQPHGRFMLHATSGVSKLPPGWESGEVEFKNPLVLKLNSVLGGRIYDDNSWKKHLADTHGKKGAALSRALVKLGHDGIVTVDDDGNTSEIVDLSPFIPKKPEQYRLGQKPIRYAKLEDYPEHQQLLKAIHENPLEATTHLVHADWLAENGFPEEEAFRRSMADMMGKKWVQNPALTFFQPRRSESMPWSVYPAKTRVPDGVDQAFIPQLPGWGSLRSDTPSHVGVPLGNGQHLHWKTYPDMEEGLRQAFHATQKRKPLSPWAPGMPPDVVRHATREQEARQSSTYIPEDEQPTQFAEGGGTPPAAGPTMGGGQYYPGGGNTYIPKMGKKKDVIKTTRYAKSPKLTTKSVLGELFHSNPDMVKLVASVGIGGRSPTQKVLRPVQTLFDPTTSGRAKKDVYGKWRWEMDVEHPESDKLLAADHNLPKMGEYYNKFLPHQEFLDRLHVSKNPQAEWDRLAQETSAGEQDWRPDSVIPEDFYAMSRGSIPTHYDRHKYCSTQINLTGIAAIRVLDLSFQIPDCDLADDGRVETAHVTVRYGLHQGTDQDAAGIIQKFGPIKLRLGKVNYFPASKEKDYDVLYVEVDSPDLVKLNKQLGKLPNTETFKYKPHATIACVKTGRGKELAAKLSPVDTDFTASHVVFSDCDHNQKWISVQPPTDTAGPVQTTTYARRNIGKYWREQDVSRNRGKFAPNQRKPRMVWSSAAQDASGNQLPPTEYDGELTPEDASNESGYEHPDPHQGFESAIDENPLESLNHDSYADFLEENGDPDEAKFRRGMAKLAAIPGGFRPARTSTGKAWTLHHTVVPGFLMGSDDFPYWNYHTHSEQPSPLHGYAGPGMGGGFTYRTYRDMEGAIRNAFKLAEGRRKRWEAEDAENPTNASRYARRYPQTPTEYEAHPKAGDGGWLIQDEDQPIERRVWDLVGTYPRACYEGLVLRPRQWKEGNWTWDAHSVESIPESENERRRWLGIGPEDDLAEHHLGKHGGRDLTASERMLVGIDPPSESFDDVPPEVFYAREHAPRGGATIDGRKYRPGAFTPLKHVPRSTPADHRAIRTGEARSRPLPPLDAQDGHGNPLGYDDPEVPQPTRQQNPNFDDFPPADETDIDPIPTAEHVPHLGHPDRAHLSASPVHHAELNLGEHGEPAGMSESWRVHYPNGTKAIFKPSSGESDERFGVPMGKQHRREVAASVVADILGIGHMVPKTTFRVLNGRNGSTQQWVDNAVKGLEAPHEHRYGKPEDTANAAVFDYIVGHADRHKGNWMVGPGGELHLIDNGYSFPHSYDPRDFRNRELLEAARRDDLDIPSHISASAHKWPEIEEALRGLGIEEPAIQLTKQRFKNATSPYYKKVADLNRFW